MNTRRRGFAFPLILIALGVAALLANFGLLAFSWTALLSLWPLILVVIGIDLLLAHRAPLAALALDVAVVALGIVFVATQPVAPFFPGISFNGRNCPAGQAQSDVSVLRQDATRLTLAFTGGAGSFHFSGGASDLVDAHSDSDDLYLSLRAPGDVRLTQCGRNAPIGAGRNVEVRIASDVPASLEVTGGAGTFDLDLRDVKLTDLRMTNGASTTTVELPKPSGDVLVRITGGASTVTIDLGGAEARVESTGGLTSLNTPSGWPTSGNPSFGRSSAESQGYAASHDRYTITMTGGVSTLNVR